MFTFLVCRCLVAFATGTYGCISVMQIIEMGNPLIKKKKTSVRSALKCFICRCVGCSPLILYRSDTTLVVFLYH